MAAPPTAGISVTNLSTLALYDLGVLGVGQTITSPQINICVLTLNQIFDSMGAERDLCYVVDRLVYPFTSGDWMYQIGPTAVNPGTLGFGPGLVNAYRPQDIQTWAVLLGSIGGNPPLELTHRRTLTADEYNQFVTLKSLTSTFPTELYYQPYDPNGVLNFWPVPQTPGNSMVLYCQSLFSAVTQSSQIMLPPGYAMYLEYALAKHAAPKFGRDVPDVVEQQYSHMKSMLKLKSNYTAELEMPFSKGDGFYNWLSDEVR